jgi:sensor histidine kinase YesM
MILVALTNASVLTTAIYVALRIARNAELSATWRSHGIAALCIGLAEAFVGNLPHWVIGPPYSAHSVLRNLSDVLRGGIGIYGIVAAVVHAVEYARRFRRSEDKGLVLRDELSTSGRRRAEAELRALKAELNPHFMGNALGAVASLVRPDPAAAERVLAELRDVLQSAISQLDVQQVTLGEEIRGLAPFLAVERARFGERLVVRWDVDAEAMDARVPHMILQPLVENAMKHGLSPRQGPGQIMVSGRRAGQRLELSVQDNGVGIGEVNGAAAGPRGGIGLANARARLRELYGADATLDLVTAREGGTVARVILPWR